MPGRRRELHLSRTDEQLHARGEAAGIVGHARDERRQVLAQRAHVDLEALAELFARPIAARLEDPEEPQHTNRRGVHRGVVYRGQFLTAMPPTVFSPPPSGQERP